MRVMDIKIPLAATLLVAGAIGLMLPSSNDGARDAGMFSAGGNENGQYAPDIQLSRITGDTVDSADSGWGGEVVFEREADGHFYANVTVDGSDYRMLVDTGASVVALIGDDAAAMGLTWFDDEVALIAQGAGGPVSGVNANIERRRLGSLQASNVRAIILTEQGSVSLLGQSFLSTIGKVEISGDRMVLSN